MTTVDRILSLAKDRGTKQAFLNDLIGGYRGKITDWKKGKSSPSETEIQIIAKYFNVSVDYLLGKTNTPTQEQHDEFTKLLQDCSLEEREQVKKYIEFIKSQRG